MARKGFRAGRGRAGAGRDVSPEGDLFRPRELERRAWRSEILNLPGTEPHGGDWRGGELSDG